MEDSVVERALVSAGRSVAHRGIAVTTMAVVACEAGLSRSTMYRHFPLGRQQLFDQLIHWEVRKFFLGLQAEVDGLSELQEVLERGLRYAHHAVKSHFLLQRILLEDPTILEPALSESMQSIRSAIVAVIEPFVAKSAHSRQHADYVARLFLDYISTPGRWDLDSPQDLHWLVRDELLAGFDEPNVTVGASKVRPLRDASDPSIRTQIINAAVTHLSFNSRDQVSLDAIGEDAGYSRASLYRTFPGGRDRLLSAVAQREGSRIFSAVADAISSHDDLHDAIAAGLTTLWFHIENHPVLTHLRLYEPRFTNSSLRFDGATRTYFVASSFAQPLLARWMDLDSAGRLAEWLCRVVVGYWSDPAAYVAIGEPASVALFYGRHMATGVSQLVNRY